MIQYIFFELQLLSVRLSAKGQRSEDGYHLQKFTEAISLGKTKESRPIHHIRNSLFNPNKQLSRGEENYQIYKANSGISTCCQTKAKFNPYKLLHLLERKQNLSLCFPQRKIVPSSKAKFKTFLLPLYLLSPTESQIIGPLSL